MSDMYWRKNQQTIGGDYVRGRGINGLITGIDMNDKEKMKKSLYRNDLLNQMDDNKLRRIDRYH